MWIYRLFHKPVLFNQNKVSLGAFPQNCKSINAEIINSDTDISSRECSDLTLTAIDIHVSLEMLAYFNEMVPLVQSGL